MLITVIFYVSLCRVWYYKRGGTKETSQEESTEDSAKASEEDKAAEESSMQEISAGDVITGENCEITINSVSLTYDVLSDDTSGFYTHYEADAGKVFIDVDVDVKNTAKQNLD